MKKVLGMDFTSCEKSVQTAKTLIFYTHTHTHTHTHVVVGRQKKSPMAILTESAVRAIRMVNAYILKSHSGVIPDLIGYPENKKTSCADFVRWILGSSPRMTEVWGIFNYVNK